MLVCATGRRNAVESSMEYAMLSFEGDIGPPRGDRLAIDVGVLDVGGVLRSPLSSCLRSLISLFLV